MQDIVQPLINGILLGGIYAAVGVGLAMIFGIVRLVNLAHGDLMIFSSYIMLATGGIIGINPYLSLMVALPIMFFVGYGIQRYILNRVLGIGMEPPLIVAFGLSIILQNTLLLIFSPDAQSLETPLAIKSLNLTDTVSIPVIYLVGFLFGVGVILILQAFFSNTYLGRAIRAASDDEMAAQYMGINTKNIFAVAMGIAQLMGAYFFGSGYQLLSGYLILIVVLAIRPQGLFGKAVRAA